MLIPKTIGPPGQSYGQHYDFMQMHYSCQLLTIYSCAFISEGGFCRCVVLSYEGRKPLSPIFAWFWALASHMCVGARVSVLVGGSSAFNAQDTMSCTWLPFGGRSQHQIVSQSYYNCACNCLCLFQAEICYILII